MRRTGIIKYLRFFFIFTFIFSQIPAFKIHAAEEGLFGKTKQSEQPVVVKGDRVEIRRGRLISEYCDKKIAPRLPRETEISRLT